MAPQKPSIKGSKKGSGFGKIVKTNDSLRVLLQK